jgi:hypothetical protein
VALAVQRTYLFALAMLVAVFVSLYPYRGAEGMCDSGSCPQMVHSATGGVCAACGLLAALAAAPTMRAVLQLLLRGALSEPPPLQVFSSPDPPPPRPSS